MTTVPLHYVWGTGSNVAILKKLHMYYMASPRLRYASPKLPPNTRCATVK